MLCPLFFFCLHFQSCIDNSKRVINGNVLLRVRITYHYLLAKYEELLQSKRWPWIYAYALSITLLEITAGRNFRNIFSIFFSSTWNTLHTESQLDKKLVFCFFFFPILLVWALLFIFLQEKVEKNKIHLKALSSEYAKYLQEKLKNKQQFSPPGCNKADQHILQVFRIWQISKRNRWWKILAQLFTYRSETDLLSTLLL